MNSKLFTLKFKEEQSFSFTRTYEGKLKDDTGYEIQFRGEAALISSSNAISRIEREAHPYYYTFEILG